MTSATAPNTIILYGIPSIVDDRCLYELLEHKVKHAIFSGFSGGRMAIVDLKENALRDTILKQSSAGLALANSLNAKKAQRAIRANTKKEQEDAKKRNRKGRKGAEAEDKAEEDSMNDPNNGITLLELLQMEMGGVNASSSTQGGSSSAASSSNAVSTPAYLQNFDGLTPEFGPFSTILINGHRVGVAASPLSAEDFKQFGGEMVLRKTDDDSNKYERPKKVRRTEPNPSTAASVSAEEGGVAAASTDPIEAALAVVKKEVVLQTTRMKAVNKEAPAFGEASAKTAKITFSDDSDDDEKPAKKPAPLSKKKTVEDENDDAAEEKKESAADGMNNRERKKLAKAAAATTTSKFKFDDSDSD